MNYIKQLNDGTTVATSEKPTWGSVSTTGDYFLNGVWYDKNGVEYTTQFSYFSENGKLVGIEVVGGEPTVIHIEDTEHDEIAPSLSLPAIHANNLKVTDGFDLGQKWVDVKSDRTSDITYKNETGKPILVSIDLQGVTSSNFNTIFVDGVVTSRAYPSTSAGGNTQAIVPNGSTYYFNQLSNGAILTWSELR